MRGKSLHKKPVVAPLAQLSMTPKKKMSLAAKFFITCFGFFVLAAAAAAYFFVGGANSISPQNIDVQVVVPSLVDSGKDTNMQIIVSNRNAGALTLADIIIDYPDGTRSVQTPGDTLTHDRQTVGTIAAGAQIKRTVDAIFYGQQGTPNTVKVTLEYSVDGSNSLFQKSGTASFIIGSSPVSVSIKSQSEAIVGQAFTMDIAVQANAETSVNNVVLQGQYPYGFTLASSSPAAAAGSNLWRLGTLDPGVVKTIHITGSIDGQDGDEKVFRFIAGTDSNASDLTVATPILTVPATLTVRRPFISASIAVNGSVGKAVAVPPGNQVMGVINWQNNLSVAVSNVQFTLSLGGAAVSKDTVNALGGFYQSSNSTIVWNSTTNPELASIAAGKSGTLQFTFGTIDPQKNPGTKPTISLSLGLTGTREGQAGVPENVATVATAQAVVASLVSVGSSALYFSGPFTNTGPLPPTVGKETTYTVVWGIKNSSGSINNATVRTVLPTYMRFVKAAPGSNVTYDAASRSVLWSAGIVEPSAGYGSVPSPTAAFQVALTPSLPAKQICRRKTQQPALQLLHRPTHQPHNFRVTLNTIPTWV
jgi:hypothetical protein